MTKKPIAIVLGGTFPHRDLILKLKNRGFYTILIDYYKNPIAKECADEHIQESTLDKNIVLNITQKYNAQLVISVCIDQANVTACYVAEKLGLPCPYDYETALLITNKNLMKKKMLENDIPTSKYYIVKPNSNLSKINLRYPVIVKPTDSNSSKGVYKVGNHKDLLQCIELSLKASRSNEAVVEEFIEGKEVGIDCFIKDKQATILISKERRKIKVLEDKVQQIYGCIWPSELSKETEQKFKVIAEKIADVFKLNNTPLMIQAMIRNDEIFVIEFAGRFGGGESFRIIQLNTDFDITEAAIDSFLGNEIAINNVPPKHIYAENFIYSNPGIFKNIDGYKELLESKTIEYIDTFKTKGMEVGKELSSNNRVGVFGVKAETRQELFDKIKTTVNAIQVYDVNNQPLMRREIY